MKPKKEIIKIISDNVGDAGFRDNFKVLIEVLVDIRDQLTKIANPPYTIDKEGKITKLYETKTN